MTASLVTADFTGLMMVAYKRDTQVNLSALLWVKLGNTIVHDVTTCMAKNPFSSPLQAKSVATRIASVRCLHSGLSIMRQFGRMAAPTQRAVQAKFILVFGFYFHD